MRILGVVSLVKTLEVVVNSTFLLVRLLQHFQRGHELVWTYLTARCLIHRRWRRHLLTSLLTSALTALTLGFPESRVSSSLFHLTLKKRW